MVIKLYTLAEIADHLRYTGCDRERSVRRLFDRYGVPVLRRDRSTFLVTEKQLASLLEAMECSPSENAADLAYPGIGSGRRGNPQRPRALYGMRSPRRCRSL